MSFQTWLDSVNRIVTRKAGIGVDDLADIDYQTLFEDDVTPTQAVEELLRENDYPMELL